MNSNSLVALVLLVSTFNLNSYAQTEGKKSNPKSGVDLIKESQVGNTGAPLKFNASEGPVNNDPRGPMQFTDKAAGGSAASAAEPSKPMNEITAEDEGFKSYIGYPKHEVGLITSYDSVSATWGYNGQEFAFKSSAFVYGVGYNFIATPMWKLGVTYSRYSVSAPAGTASGFTITNSDESLDQYGINTEYCSISSKNFYRQYCFGGLIYNDAYPVLKFTSGTNLVMSKVEDIVVGVFGAIQLPLTEKILFKPILGYNYGTGAGASGTLTPKGNSKLYFRGEVPWTLNQKMTLKFHGDYSSRQATIEGKIGANDDKWETDSTVLGFGADFSYVF